MPSAKGAASGPGMWYFTSMDYDTCAICGGDGRVSNAFGGGGTTCPACHGTGRRHEDVLIRDVTKTKPSHYKLGKAADSKEPMAMTFEGKQLSGEVERSAVQPALRAKLLREIIEYEQTHGRCTQTFCKKVRKQLR